jgi:hypothetical protein
MSDAGFFKVNNNKNLVLTCIVFATKYFLLKVFDYIHVSRLLLFKSRLMQL